MRFYALVFGVLLTSAYGYAAQVAVTSANPTRSAAARSASAPSPGKGSDELWYGGVLDPITVESGQVVAPPAVSARRLFPLEGPNRACVGASHRLREVVL